MKKNYFALIIRLNRIRLFLLLAIFNKIKYNFLKAAIQIFQSHYNWIALKLNFMSFGICLSWFSSKKFFDVASINIWIRQRLHNVVSKHHEFLLDLVFVKEYFKLFFDFAWGHVFSCTVEEFHENYSSFLVYFPGWMKKNISFWIFYLLYKFTRDPKQT